MGYREELKKHYADMASSLRAATRLRPMLQLAMLVISAVLIFAVGLMNGIMIEVNEGGTRNERTDAAWRMAEAAAESKGDQQLTERFRRRAADAAVVGYTQKPPRSRWEQMATDFVYGRVWKSRLSEDKERDFIRKIAEQRLQLLRKPQPATLDEFNRRGMADALRSIEEKYAKVASSYSQVLGRAITSSELLTEAELREHLQSVDLQKAMAGGK